MTDRLNLLITDTSSDLDFDLRSEDFEFYRELAGRKPAKILDLGSGSGRLSLGLAKMGHSVTSLDKAQDKLHILSLRAQRASVPVTVVHSRIQGFHFEEQYDRIFSAFGTIMHLSENEIIELLASIERALYDDGTFIVDVANPTRHLAIDGTYNFLQLIWRKMILSSGLRIEKVFGSYRKDPLEEKSPRLLIVCRK